VANQFQQSQLQEAVGAHLGGAELTFAPIPTGKFNTSYFVSGAPGEFVVRIAPPADAGFIFYERRMMAQEPEIHQLVREETSVPVAEVLAFDTSRRALPREFILMRRLPGTALSETGATVTSLGEVYRQVGRALRQIHGITRSRYGYLGAHRPMEPRPSWREAFEAMWNRLLDDIEACGGYSREEGKLARLALFNNLEAFDYDGPARLLHMDVWAQNVLVDAGGRLTGLVDFDRALWGDPEIEFAVLDYCGVSVPEFWEGYGAERPRGPAAELRRLFYYLYEVQKYIVIERLRRNNPSRAEGYKRQAFTLMARAMHGGSRGGK
jgi:aminoglycoside phosphotransferase (APT) family kinase protein